MTAIFKRELKSYFHGMMGYVLTAFLLATSGLYFLALDLGYGMTDFSYYTLYRTIFILLPGRLIAAAPTSFFLLARYRYGASCWASFLPWRLFLRSPASWIPL